MSEKRTITLEVETSVMFDAVHKMGGDFGPVGQRLASVLLGGPDLRDILGLALYGIHIINENVAKVEG